MAVRQWLGGAQAVAQVSQATITAYDTATTYSVTINGKTVSVVGQGGSVATTAAALVTELNNSTLSEFAEVTWTSNAGTVIGTAATAGKPFTATSSASGGTGTFGPFANTTASSGPNHWDTAANWSGGVIPVTGDDVYFQESDDDILYGINQAAVTLASLNIHSSFVGRIGLPQINVDNTPHYAEYRHQYLSIGATVVNIGFGPGRGPRRVKLDTGSVQTALTVYNTGVASESLDNLEAVLWKGTHAGNVVTVTRGTVGIAVLPDETAVVSVLRIGRVLGANDARVRCSSSVTLTDVHKDSGTAEFNSAITNYTQGEGLGIINGTGGVANLTINGGKCVYNTTGTLGGNPVVSGDGELDFSQDPRIKTVTNPIEVFGDVAKVTDPDKVVSSLVIDANYGVNGDRFNIGRNVRITRGTPA